VLSPLDGKKFAGFVWPRTLAYYVEQYDVELPAEFEEHMKRNQWRVPSEIDLGPLRRAVRPA